VACRVADRYRIRAARHAQLSGVVTDAAIARLHRDTAAACSAAASRAGEVASILGGILQTRQEWDALTADTLRVAVAAVATYAGRGCSDADRMVSAEPEAFTYEGSAEPGEDEARKALGLETESISGTVPERLTELSLMASRAQGRIDELRSMAEPDRDGDEDLVSSEAWSKLIGRERQTVLQPAGPPLPISPRVAQAVAERDAKEREAG